MMRRAVVIGASWGGLHALQLLLGALTPAFNTPVLVALHRAEGSSGETLCELVQSRTHLRVAEAEDKQPLQAGTVVIAPAGYHVLVDSGDRLSLSTDAPEQFVRPSIDLLFDSAAHQLRSAVVGAILTGTGRDGASGIAAIKAMGGLTLAQEPDSAERRDMPQAAIDTGSVDRVLELEQMAELIEVACA